MYRKSKALWSAISAVSIAFFAAPAIALQNQETGSTGGPGSNGNISSPTGGIGNPGIENDANATSTDLNNTAIDYGGNGGVGGASFISPYHGGTGGAGSDAVATAVTENNSDNSEILISSDATSTGGNGGFGGLGAAGGSGDNEPGSPGGIGGAGGDADLYSLCEYPMAKTATIAATATGTGGIGGTGGQGGAKGTGKIGSGPGEMGNGGVGGSAILDSLAGNSSTAVSLEFTLTGGAGGVGGNGGAGGSESFIQTATGSQRIVAYNNGPNGTMQLSGTLIGGIGGNGVSGNGGNGGPADCEINFAQGGSSASTSDFAFGGAGGNAQNGNAGNGGTTTANMALYVQTTAQVFAQANVPYANYSGPTAQGGDLVTGVGTAGAGGNGSANANAAGTGAGSADAEAHGGAGGYVFSAAVGGGGSGGTASATASDDASTATNTIASAVGGAGGAANGSGYAGGAGGSAAATASAAAGNVIGISSVAAIATGGAGASGTTGGIGGNASATAYESQSSGQIPVLASATAGNGGLNGDGSSATGGSATATISLENNTYVEQDVPALANGVGGAAYLSYTNGLLTVNSAPAGTLTVYGSGAISSNRLTEVGNLTLYSMVALKLAPGAGVSSISGLYLSASNLLDLTNNDLIIHNGDLAALTNYLDVGFNQGAWGGAGGITSSAAAATTNAALAIELNSTGSSALLSTFDGQPVTSTDVLIKYTYFGDANLDGVVNGSDYTLIDNGFNNSLTGWHNGDFNYDGVVNGDDYTLIDNAFNTQGASLAAAIPPRSGGLMDAEETAQLNSTTVPEPIGFGGIVFAAMGFSARRNRRKNFCAGSSASRSMRL